MASGLFRPVPVITTGDDDSASVTDARQAADRERHRVITAPRRRPRQRRARVTTTRDRRRQRQRQGRRKAVERAGKRRATDPTGKPASAQAATCRDWRGIRHGPTRTSLVVFCRGGSNSASKPSLNVDHPDQDFSGAISRKDEADKAIRGRLGLRTYQPRSLSTTT